jgi:hypothetical protein
VNAGMIGAVERSAGSFPDAPLQSRRSAALENYYLDVPSFLRQLRRQCLPITDI